MTLKFRAIMVGFKLSSPHVINFNTVPSDTHGHDECFVLICEVSSKEWSERNKINFSEENPKCPFEMVYKKNP